MEISSYRRTGRTTKILNEVVLKFIDGFNIIVTGYSFRYSLDLQNIVCDILSKKHLQFKAERGKVFYNDQEIIFTRHLESYDIIREFVPISINKTYLLFEDHFKGVSNGKKTFYI